MIYTMFNGHSIDELGLIPDFIWEKDSRRVADQINERYAHGGGWFPIAGFSMDGNILHYPEDSPLHPIGKTELRDEEILFYKYAIVVVRQSNGSFEVGRLD